MSQFEQCSLVLERELGVNPLPETRAAYRAVLEGRPQVLPFRTPSPRWTTLPSLETPLIGRDKALRYLEEAYACAQAGRGRMVLISGEPGIGKSRLMQEFVTRLGGEANVIIGGGHQAERGLPYWPLVEALRPQLHTLGHAMSEIGPAYAAELARLWPELRGSLPDLPVAPHVEPGQARGRLFQALSCWVLSLAARRPPLVLCLDDLHWVDEATLGWLGYLARHLGQAPLLVLGAYRSEQAGAVEGLRVELMRQGLLQEVRLNGLSQSEVLRLISHLPGEIVEPERLGQRLHQATGGNPFFVLEILRAMLQDEILWQDDPKWSLEIDESVTDFREPTLPDSVCEAIRARVRRLSPQACQVLEAGAVIGRRFSFDLAWASSGRNQAETVDALDELSARQIIVERDDKYWFGHDLIRAVVYRDLSYGRRRLLHRRAAEAMERLDPDSMAAIAWHFERAEELGRAARYALQAGLAAKMVFAHAEARAYFERALACLEEEAAHLNEPEAMATNRRLRIQALHERGWALRLLGDMNAYARDSQEVTRLAELQGDQRTLAHLRWREAYTHRWFCRYADAQEAAVEGLRLSRAANDPLLEAMCEREVGLAARERGDHLQAQTSLERAWELFTELGETAYQVHTLGNLSTIYWCTGDYDRAMNLARKAMVRCEGARLSLERRLPLGDIGAAAVALGQADQAREWLLESLAISRQVTDRTQEIFCLGHLGWLEVKLGRASKALEHLEAALSLAEGIDSRAEQSWLRSGLAEAHRLAGDTDLALESGQQALKLAETQERACDQRLAQGILAELGWAAL
jgi:tetratricopeptide (TPR) repeat protein